MSLKSVILINHTEVKLIEVNCFVLEELLTMHPSIKIVESSLDRMEYFCS